MRSKIGILSDSKHWRDRAEEMRAIANALTNEECKQRLLACAEDYERMAEHASNRSMLREED